MASASAREDAGVATDRKFCFRPTPNGPIFPIVLPVDAIGSQRRFGPGPREPTQEQMLPERPQQLALAVMELLQMVAVPRM